MKCDLTFKDKIREIPGADQLTCCFLCGTCSAGCPIAELDDTFSPRNIMRQTLLGDTALLESDSIWKCIQCQACVARCPQDARPADVIGALREYAAQKGIVPRELPAKVDEMDIDIRRKHLEKIQELLQEAGITGKDDNE